MKKLTRVFSLAACKRRPGTYFYPPSFVHRALALLLALAMIFVGGNVARAGWDPSKPANNSALVSAEIRSNWDALQTSIEAINLCNNGDMLRWSGGTTAAPDGFILTGAGATIARTGPAESDTFTFGAGRFAAKVTRSGADAKLTWTVVSTGQMADNAALKGKSISVGAYTKSSTASHIRLTIDDGVGTSSSSYHTGGGSAEWLSLTRVLNAGATKLEVYAEVNSTNAAAYLGGLHITYGEVKPLAWAPSPDACGLIYYSTTAVGNVGAGEDDLMSYPIQANTLNYDGKALRITAWGDYGANGNSKIMRGYFAGTGVVLMNGAPNAQNWKAEMMIVRTGASAQVLSGWSFIRGAGADVFTPAQVTPAGDTTTTLTAKFTGDATSNNDVRQQGMMVEVLCWKH
jgi:hypothetical protein